MYRETVFCAQKELRVFGQNCNLHDVGTRLAQVYDIIGPGHTDYSTCKLQPEVGSICASEDRLSHYTLVACGAYLNQMLFGGNSYQACVYSNSLVECAQHSLGYLRVTCSKAEVEGAFKSQSAIRFLKQYVHGLDLAQCYKTVSVNEDKNCVDFASVFSYGNIINCVSTLSNANITDNMDKVDKDMQCSFVQEVEACMIRQLRQEGSHCTMAQMKSVLNMYIHLSATSMGNLYRITECPDNASYVSSSVCSNDFRVASFFVVAAGIIFGSLNNYNNKDLVCSTMSSYVPIFTIPMDIHCSSAQIFSALTSSFGTSIINSSYPNLDLNHCLTSSVTQSPEREHGVSKRRNVVHRHYYTFLLEIDS